MTDPKKIKYVIVPKKGYLDIADCSKFLFRRQELGKFAIKKVHYIN